MLKAVHADDNPYHLYIVLTTDEMKKIATVIL